MTLTKLALVATRESTDLDTDGEYLIPACERAGFEVSVPIWSDPNVDWSSFDLVVVRATWDYFRAPGDFLAWVNQASKLTRFYNGPEVIAWNLDKRYLDEVAAAGFPVIATTFVAESGQMLPDIAGPVVVKPTISAGSNDTTLYQSGADPEVRQHVDRLVQAGRVAMVQPYVAEIDTLGERGLVYYRGVLDHTFRKEPLLVGDVEETALFLREEVSAVQPTQAEQHLGDGVCDWLANRFGGVLYARIDLVEQAGEPVIMEIELIEPGFFLNVDPPSADRFAAVLKRLL